MVKKSLKPMKARSLFTALALAIALPLTCLHAATVSKDSSAKEVSAYIAQELAAGKTPAQAALDAMSAGVAPAVAASAVITLAPNSARAVITAVLKASPSSAMAVALAVVDVNPKLAVLVINIAGTVPSIPSGQFMELLSAVNLEVSKDTSVSLAVASAGPTFLNPISNTAISGSH